MRARKAVREAVRRPGPASRNSVRESPSSLRLLPTAAAGLDLAGRSRVGVTRGVWGEGGRVGGLVTPRKGLICRPVGAPKRSAVKYETKKLLGSNKPPPTAVSKTSCHSCQSIHLCTVHAMTVPKVHSLCEQPQCTL